MGIYSKDLRTRALAAVGRGVPRREVLETFSVPLTALKRWLRMRREGKDLSPGVSTGRKRRILATPEEEKKALWEQLEENDDALPSSATARCGRGGGARRFRSRR